VYNVGKWKQLDWETERLFFWIVILLRILGDLKILEN